MRYKHVFYEVKFTYRAALHCVGEESQQKHPIVLSALPSSTRHCMASHKSRDGLGHRCFGLCGALIGLEFLLMDPFLMPSFWPITTAIDWICNIGHCEVTVLDGMNLFCVHDKAI
jgi:hypothetical protein